MRPLPLVCVLLAGSFIAGCGSPARQAGVKDLQELRSYIIPTTVQDPQAQWNPATYQIVARSLKGVAILDEGSGNQVFLASAEGRESCHPCWINQTQFVFGPPTLMVRTADNRQVANTQGLTVVTLGGGTRTIVNRGYRPRMWNNLIVAQDEERVVTIDQQGVIEDFAPGFFAEPQRSGPGICFLEKPVTEPDLWSGDTKRRGNLIIRWKKGAVTLVPDAIEPRWTADGGVVATVLRAEPQAGRPWWEGGTDLVHIAGPDAKPVVIAADARAAAPHPFLPICAAVDSANGALLLCDLAGGTRLRKADLGDHPQWSHDGVRLMAEEPIEEDPKLKTKQGLKALHVYVLKVK